MKKQKGKNVSRKARKGRQEILSHGLLFGF